MVVLSLAINTDFVAVVGIIGCCQCSSLVVVLILAGGH